MPKSIPDLNEWYDVFPNGTIWSKRRNKFMSPSKDGGGYFRLTIFLNKESRNFHVHRIIADKFLPKIEGKLFLNHKNGIKTDNRIENLEWCTNAENLEHALRTGLMPPRNSYIGEKNAFAKFKEKDVREVFRLYKSGIRPCHIQKQFP